MENYDYDNTCQLADSPSYAGGWMDQLPSCATSSGGGGESGFEEDLGDARWAAHVTCDQDRLTAADVTSLSEGCNHPANLIATVATLAQLGATPEAAPVADSGIYMPSHVAESPHAAAAPPLLTCDPTGSNSYQPMHMASPRCSETQHPFRNSFLSGLRTPCHSARQNQPANLGGSLLPASAQHWVTIAQLLWVADHPHILRLLQSHESAYQPVLSTHDASTAMGAAPVSLVEWQSYSIPVGPEVYNLCINPMPSARPAGRTTPSRTPASINIHIDSATANPRIYQILKDVTSQLESDLHAQDSSPAAILTNCDVDGDMPATLQSAMEQSRCWNEKLSVCQTGTPVAALLRTHPLEDLTGMSGWDPHKQMHTSKATVFTLPKPAPRDGFSLFCLNTRDVVTQVSPDLVLTDSGANCNVCTQTFMRKHKLKCLRYTRALDTSAGGTIARIIGCIPRMKMVMKHETTDELAVYHNMFVISGCNPLFEVILGTPALLAMGAFTDPLLSTFFYRPRWQSSANLQNIVGVPSKVALACANRRSTDEQMPSPHILGWRKNIPMSLLAVLSTRFDNASLVENSDDEECFQVVAPSDGDNCSDDKGCMCACCVAIACERCRQEYVTATSRTGSVSTDTSTFSHKILNTIDYVWPPETPLVDAAAREPVHAQPTGSPVMQTTPSAGHPRAHCVITPDRLRLSSDPSILPELLDLCQCEGGEGQCPPTPLTTPRIVHDLFAVSGPPHAQVSSGGAECLPPNPGVDSDPSPSSSRSAERGSTSPDIESAVEQSASLLLSWLTGLASCAPLYAPMNVMPVLLLA
jgi:hypothetical protein